MKSRRTIVDRDPQALTCSTCGKRFLPDETPVPPFCSVRCQQVDLGRWLDEEIGVPHESEDLDPEAFRNDHPTTPRTNDPGAMDSGASESGSPDTPPR